MTRHAKVAVRIEMPIAVAASEEIPVDDISHRSRLRLYNLYYQIIVVSADNPIQIVLPGLSHNPFQKEDITQKADLPIHSAFPFAP